MFAVAIAVTIFSSPAARAETAIDLAIIRTIESGGDPSAVNFASGCYGLYQISEVCLEDYNQQHDSHYKIRDLFKPAINEMIASWYFARIAEMLRAYRIPVTVTTLIASYNWGIGRVAAWSREGMSEEALPKETRRYIEKYMLLSAT